MAELRFCAYQYAHLELPELTARWRQAEELGFDVLWNCDPMNDPDRPRSVFSPLTPWESPEYFRDMVGRYYVFEEVCREVMPALRG
jgi:hypothetical protein